MLGIRANLKRDLLKNTIRQGNELESFKSDSTNVDKLNAKGTQGAKTQGMTNKKIATRWERNPCG